MQIDSGKIVTVKELADYLKVHASTLYRQLKLVGCRHSRSAATGASR